MALLELIRNAKKISDGSGKPDNKYVNDEYISNSYLTMILKELSSKQQFFGNEQFLKFGNELHKRFLTPRIKRYFFDKTTEKLLKNMLNRLNSEKRLLTFMRGAKIEQRSVKPIQIYGQLQKVKVILDIQKGNKAKDLKSTSCLNEKSFLKAAVEYGYFRQAWLYSEAMKIRDFDFEGISKKNKHPLFLLPVNDFKIEKQQGMEEAKELISIHIALKRFTNSH